jgi:voltage-gated potassium channel
MNSLRKRVAFYLEDIQTPLGVTINLIILGLIFLSLAIFVTETYEIPEKWQDILNVFDYVILSLFLLEYSIRFWCAESKIKFVFSIFSILDLMAIIPLFLGVVDVRFFRVFRWFRFLRIIRFIDFKLAAFKIKRRDGIIFIRILLTLSSIVFVYSGLIYQIEHKTNPQVFRNFFDALYFSIVTMTTVGFGDVIPLSDSGRLLTVLMILTGILVIPWQLGDLTEQLSQKHLSNKACSKCGLSLHDADANYCKICGNKL